MFVWTGKREIKMLEIFKTVNGKIQEEKEVTSNCWVALIDPTSAEIRHISKEFGIDEGDIRAPLDEEERSRIDVEDEYTLILVDIPVIEERNDKDWYGTIPMGIIIQGDVIFTICLQDTPVLQSFKTGRVKGFHTYMKSRFILQILYRNASLYLQYLRSIDHKCDEIERRLKESQKNQELIELLELEKSLVYLTTSLRANEVVLEKLMKNDRFKQYPEDMELLEDVIIENKQAIEMGSIYSGVVSGTRDAFASIISNNLNVVMKFLTTVTIVLSIPTMIASFYGMNVNLSGMPFAQNENGFAIVIGIAIIASLIVTIIFAKKKMF